MARGWTAEADEGGFLTFAELAALVDRVRADATAQGDNYDDARPHAIVGHGAGVKRIDVISAR